ncbi:Plastid movement impaired protein [Rhynchospora pubera]|uniref:Plastid movement impaired protein n=1 Tax=Rhynchospora pubera TaxID=906938 RepID=A0AAV8E9B8_9POAL|nr:Plastid movement impaired protein [Rhynchospora pubera]
MAENSNASLQQPITTPRRHATSLVLPRSPRPISIPDTSNKSEISEASILAHSPHGSSFSLWRPHTRQSDSDGRDTDNPHQSEIEFGNQIMKKKHGVKNWKALRAISHIRMRRISCLFSVEAVAIRGLPASTNGLRLAVTVRKDGSKDGASQTLPCRVLNGHADFDETLFVRCHLYFTGGAGTGKPVKFESKSFVVSVVAVDAPQLNFGKGMVNLSSLVLESVEKSLRGSRARHWEKVFQLHGKAVGGELVVKLGFQIMEGGNGLGIYSNDSYEDSALPRRQTKSSFSVTSPRVGRSESDLTHSRSIRDSPRLSPRLVKNDGNIITEDFCFPEFEVLYKGIENTNEDEEVQSKSSLAGSSASSEVVKEMVNYRARSDMLLELEMIDKEIKALESKVLGRNLDPIKVPNRNYQMDELYSEEETLTNEFLQMLEQKNELLTPRKAKIENERKVLIPDLGNGVGPVIQTRDEGFLISMNPFNTEVVKAEAPKLVMQVSKPFVLKTEKISNGFEVFQRIAAIGSKDLESKFLSWADMDDLMGKSAEQVAYEGIASFIINGRNKEGANSGATQSIQIVKMITKSMVEGRKQRIMTGIWNVAEKDPSDIEEILAFSVQKIEAMAIDALKIQGRVSEEGAPFGISRIIEKNTADCIFDALEPADNYMNSSSDENHVTVLFGIILRDPLRRNEVVGAPMIVTVQATKSNEDNGNYVFRVTNLHMGGLQSRLAGERRRLTALQWLIAHGLVRKKIERQLPVKTEESSVWSVSTRVMADMWLKTLRNPDVKVLN